METGTVLFLCPHNAAKSVLAAVDFDRMARARGLNYQAASAGTEPDAQPSPAVVAALRAEGIDVSDHRPRAVTRRDLATARRVISLGCDLSDLAPPNVRMERWDDVPPTSRDLEATRAAIRRRVAALVDELERGERKRRGRRKGGSDMQWVTRARPKVDRIACPWLIARFVDPEAEFLYVPAEEVMAVAERTSAIPFDVPGVELGHHGPECSFDAILKKYDLTDPALHGLARIVRGADTPAKDLTPESPGLEAIAEGFRLLFQDDQAQLGAESIVYDALYAYCQQSVTGAR